MLVPRRFLRSCVFSRTQEVTVEEVDGDGAPPRTRAAPWFHPELPARQKEKELIPRMQKLLCPPQRTPLEGCQVINTSETDALSCTVSANCVRPGGVNPTQVALGHVKDVCDIMVII